MSADLDVGHVLKGKYRIDRKSSTGSLGDEVYIGSHLDLKCEILIRVLPPSMTANKETAERFVQGVRLTAALQHPNILPAYDAGEEAGHYFFVTGYEKGYFLKEYVAHRGKLGEAEAVKIVAALADALEEAWEKKKIIHRNVCPDTILIARENNPMLTDFGMAKSQESERSLTMDGFIVGNPQYMSPEQVKAEKELDFHADMYCLGLVFYELLAGRPAFESSSQVALLLAQETEQPQSLKDLNREVSDRCVAIVNRMIEKDRDKRYPTWSSLAKELKKLLEPAAPKAATAKDKAGAEDPDKKIKDFVQFLAKENKRKMKRNILIVAVIVNLALLAAAGKYLYDKQKAAQARSVPAKTATP